MSDPSGEAFPRDEYFRSFDALPLHRALGITLEERRPDYARICLRTGPVTIGGVGGSVHGGVLAAMVDIVILAAMFSRPIEGATPAGTADLGITYLRPALTKHVYAEATVVKRGRQLNLIEVSILDENGTLCARGRVLYALRPASG
ncbi:MAG: hypothetical protein Kow0010_04340 [Dehalococcoidia bacterium]